jgi:hypothetical protein
MEKYVFDELNTCNMNILRNLIYLYRFILRRRLDLSVGARFIKSRKSLFPSFTKSCFGFTLTKP